MRGSIAALALVWSISAALAAAPRAKAQADVDALIDRGNALLAEHRDDEAYAVLEEAHRLAPSARTLALLALSEQALARWLDAETHLATALESDDPWIARHRAPLTEALDVVRGHLGELQIAVSVEGAEVVVDGRPAGLAPLAALRVVAGTVVVRVAASGHHAITREVRVDARGVARERFELVPLLDDEPGMQRAPHALDVSPARAGASVAAEEPTTRAPIDATPFDAAAVVLGASSVAAIVVGASALAVREEHLARWNDDARCARVDGPGRDEECPHEARTWRDAEVVALVGLLGAGALAIGALVVALSRPGDSEVPTVACGIDASGVSCVASGRF